MNTEYKELLDRLYEGKLIYHERVTILCELIKYELMADSFKLELKAIKPLHNEFDFQNAIYKYIISKPTFEVSSPYEVAYNKVLNGKKIGIAYCPFTIWADPVLVEKVSKLTDEELNVQLHDLIWS